jgi:multiple sugar transport system substrate-binding protein
VPKGALCPGKKPAAHITVVNWWQTLASPDTAKAAAQFNCAHPDIAINMSIDPNVGDDNNGKLLAAVSAKKPPDLVLSYDDVLSAWAAKGELQPIEQDIAGHGLQKSQFNDYAWRSTLWAGHQYGLPVDWDPDTLLWYNKKIFAEVGLDPNKPPTTWDEIQADAKKIDLVQGGKLKRLGFVPWVGWQFNYVQLGHLFGSDFKDGSSHSAVLDTPEMRKVFEYEQSVSKKFGGSAKINSFTTVTGAQGASADPLLSGRVGMLMIGDWEIGQEANVGKAKFNKTIGVTALPPPPGGKQYLSHSGWSFMVPKGSKHKKEAMEFAAWMSQPKNFATYIGPSHGWLPARTDTMTQPYLTADPAWQEVIAVDKKIGTQWWLQPSPIIQQYYRILDETQDSIIALEKSPAGGLKQAQSQIQAALDDATALGVYRE